MSRDSDPLLRASVTFALHVLVAGALFSLLAIMGAGIYIGTGELVSYWNLPAILGIPMRGIELMLILADGVCFTFLVGIASYRFCRQIWKDRKDLDDD